jgi:hypothetical protein
MGAILGGGVAHQTSHSAGGLSTSAKKPLAGSPPGPQAHMSIFIGFLDTLC